MAKFTVRVELLNDADGEQYKELHGYMKNLGLLKMVQGRDNKVDLPTGLYYGEMERTCKEVRDIVVSYAKIVDKDFKVFVAETTTWASHG